MFIRERCQCNQHFAVDLALLNGTLVNNSSTMGWGSARLGSTPSVTAEKRVHLKEVTSFIYLGAMVSKDGRRHADVRMYHTRDSKNCKDRNRTTQA